MKPMNVYLQYPWRFPDSPYYKSLIGNPPQGIKYLNAKKMEGGATSSRYKFIFLTLLRKSLDIF